MPATPPSSSVAASAASAASPASAAAPLPLPWVPSLLVLAAGLFAWWGAFACDFKFDDLPAITGNDALLAGDWWTAAFGPTHQPLSHRPLACLSLCLDFVWAGSGPRGPHAMNVLLHLGNALLLFVLARRALSAPNLRGRFVPPSAHRLALAIAALWVVHPLATDAVAYATQRSTLLTSGCLLLATWSTLRAHASPTTATRWRAAAVLALAAGMASKEEMVVGPLLVLGFERAFLLPDWRTTLRRPAWLGALAASWLVLLGCAALGPANPTVGYRTQLGTTAWQWLLTQAPVVLGYLRLAAWPSPLRGAYDGGVASELGPAVLPGLAVLGLLALMVWCWRRRPWWGWLLALFFLWLAPTSSVLPIVTEIVAERRAYLPMLLVVAAAVFGGRGLLARLAPAAITTVGAAAVLAAVLGLALLTRQHVPSYADQRSFWQHAFDHRDPASRTMLAAQILGNQGSMLFGAGRVDEAAALFDLAMQCDHPTYAERTHWAASLQQRGRHAEAVQALEQAIAENPAWAESHGTLGTCLLMEFERAPLGPGDARLQRAAAALERAVQLEPRRIAFWNSLGGAYERQQRAEPAAEAYRRATLLPYQRIEPFASRDRLLRRLGRAAEATAMWQELLRTRPGDVDLRLRAAGAVAQAGDRELATAMLREVLQLAPGHPAATAGLQQLTAPR